MKTNETRISKIISLVLAFAIALLTPISTGAADTIETKLDEKQLRKKAEQGDHEAQYLLGLKYSNGDGVPTNRIEGYKWLHIAIASGSKDALGARWETGKNMTPDEIAEAKRQASAVRSPETASSQGAPQPPPSAVKPELKLRPSEILAALKDSKRFPAIGPSSDVDSWQADVESKKTDKFLELKGGDGIYFVNDVKNALGEPNKITVEDTPGYMNASTGERLQGDVFWYGKVGLGFTPSSVSPSDLGPGLFYLRYKPAEEGVTPTVAEKAVVGANKGAPENLHAKPYELLEKIDLTLKNRAFTSFLNGQRGDLLQWQRQVEEGKTKRPFGFLGSTFSPNETLAPEFPKLADFEKVLGKSQRTTTELTDHVDRYGVDQSCPVYWFGSVGFGFYQWSTMGTFFWTVHYRPKFPDAATESAAGTNKALPDNQLLPTPGNWPSYAGELQGNIEVRVTNPNNFKVRVGLRSDGKGRDFTVATNKADSVRVPRGHYDIYFQYSSEPEGVYQGDSFDLKNDGVQIQIVKVVNGNYGIRKVK